MNFSTAVVQRFESNFVKRKGNKCWEWKAFKDRHGRGKFKVGHEQYASRVSYRLYVGELPPKLLVCHTCDNPGCVNPKHLFLGTHKDNVQDMLKKGRANPEKGEDRHCAKLTEEQVLEIRRRYQWTGYRSNTWTLAKEFGIARSSVVRIVYGRTWKHLRSKK